MSSDQGTPHQQGVRVGKRNLAGILERNRQLSADNRWVIYVRPLGRGRHRVKTIQNDATFVVKSTNPNATFTPNSVVIIGSNTGRPGEVILGLPDSGRGGRSQAPIARASQPVEVVSMGRTVDGGWPFPDALPWGLGGMRMRNNNPGFGYDTGGMTPEGDPGFSYVDADAGIGIMYKDGFQSPVVIAGAFAAIFYLNVMGISGSFGTVMTDTSGMMVTKSGNFSINGVDLGLGGSGWMILTIYRDLSNVMRVRVNGVPSPGVIATGATWNVSRLMIGAGGVNNLMADVAPFGFYSGYNPSELIGLEAGVRAGTILAGQDPGDGGPGPGP